MSDAGLHVVVVGGGITGLSAAHHLVRAAAEAHADVRVTVVEAGACVGGKLRTFHRDGCVIEGGPDSFLARGASLRPLLRAVGLEDEVVAASALPTFVYAGGRLRALPAGTVLGVPTRLLPFLRTRLVGPAAKVRAAWDLLRPDDAPAADESIGWYLRRRLGNGLVDGLIAPLLAGIHGRDIDHLSLQATPPHFLALKGNQRSVIWGARAWSAKARSAVGETADPRWSGTFLSLRHGMQSLPEALARHLPPGAVVTGAAVDRIASHRGRYRVVLCNGAVLDADAVVLAVPGEVAMRVLHAADWFGPLGRTVGTSVATVTLGFAAAALLGHCPGTGFLVSPGSGCAITACTWSHAKWPHAVAPGHALLRCYVGGAGSPRSIDAPDEEIVAAVVHDLRRIMKLDVAPEFHVVTRWIDAMPGYPVGHAAHVATARTALAERLPGVLLAGAAYDGVGVADCVRQGQAAAEATLEHLRVTTWPGPVMQGAGPAASPVTASFHSVTNT